MGEDEKITVQNSRISTRYNHVIFPLDVIDFAKALTKAGFALLTPLPPLEPTFISRRVYVGPLARLDSTTIDVNYEKQFIGVADPNLNKMIERFDLIMEILKDPTLCGAPLSPWFTELQCHFEAKTSIRPKKTLSVLSREFNLITDLSKVMEEELMIGSIKAISANSDPDSTDYSEIVIEPSPGGETSSFEIVIINRKKDANYVRQYALDLENRISALMAHFQ